MTVRELAVEGFWAEIQGQPRPQASESIALPDPPRFVRATPSPSSGAAAGTRRSPVSQAADAPQGRRLSRGVRRQHRSPPPPSRQRRSKAR